MSNKINYLNLYSIFKINLLKKLIIVLCNKLKDKKLTSDSLLNIINKEEAILPTNINVIPYKSYIFLYKNKVKIFIWLLWYLDKKKQFLSLKKLNNYNFISNFLSKKNLNKNNKSSYLKRVKFLSDMEVDSKSKNWMDNINNSGSFSKFKDIKDVNYFENCSWKKKLYSKPFDKRKNLFFINKIKQKWYNVKQNKTYQANKINYFFERNNKQKLSKGYIKNYFFVKKNHYQVNLFDAHDNFDFFKDKLIKNRSNIFQNQNKLTKNLLILQYFYLIKTRSKIKNVFIKKKSKKLAYLYFNNLLNVNVFKKLCFNKFNYFKKFNYYSYKIETFFKKNIINFFKDNHLKIFIKIGFSKNLKNLIKYQINMNFKFLQRKNLILLSFLEQLVMLFLLKDLYWFLVFFLKEFEKRDKAFLALLNLKNVLNSISFFHFNIIGFYLQIKGKLYKRSRRKVKHILSRGVRPIKPNIVHTYVQSANLNLKAGSFGFKLWLLSIN